jgi:hypothetical protein
MSSRELLCVHVGHAGAHIGDAAWAQALVEHGACVALTWHAFEMMMCIARCAVHSVLTRCDAQGWGRTALTPRRRAAAAARRQRAGACCLTRALRASTCLVLSSWTRRRVLAALVRCTYARHASALTRVRHLSARAAGRVCGAASGRRAPRLALPPTAQRGAAARRVAHRRRVRRRRLLRRGARCRRASREPAAQPSRGVRLPRWPPRHARRVRRRRRRPRHAASPRARGA